MGMGGTQKGPSSKRIAPAPVRVGYIASGVDETDPLGLVWTETRAPPPERVLAMSDILHPAARGSRARRPAQ